MPVEGDVEPIEVVEVELSIAGQRQNAEENRVAAVQRRGQLVVESAIHRVLAEQRRHAASV